MKSIKKILELDEIVKPYEIIFPVTVEGSVNNDFFKFNKGEKVYLTYPQYEAIKHSEYGKLLD